MSKKTPPPLSGYSDQPDGYTAKDGRLVPAGEAVELAVARYHKANPGLDVSQLPLAWNNLTDGNRRDWVELALEELDEQLEASSRQADVATTMTIAAPAAEKRLGAELIDAALSEVKALSRPWQQMSADQQDEVLDRLTRRVREAVGETINLLATRGSTHIVCDFDQITVKKGAKAVLSVGKDSIGEELLDAVGQQVILVLAGKLDPLEISKPEPDPDQPDLLSQVGGSGVVHSDPED